MNNAGYIGLTGQFGGHKHFIRLMPKLSVVSPELGNSIIAGIILKSVVVIRIYFYYMKIGAIFHAILNHFNT